MRRAEEAGSRGRAKNRGQGLRAKDRGSGGTQGQGPGGGWGEDRVKHRDVKDAVTCWAHLPKLGKPIPGPMSAQG